MTQSMILKKENSELLSKAQQRLTFRSMKASVRTRRTVLSELMQQIQIKESLEITMKIGYQSFLIYYDLIRGKEKNGQNAAFLEYLMGMEEQLALIFYEIIYINLL